MTARLLYFSIGLAALALAAGLALTGDWAWTAAGLALCALWCWGQARRWGAVASLGLTGCVVLAGVGAGLGAPGGLMLLALLAALSAWDLDHLRRRLEEAEPPAMRALIERRHLTRLAVITGLGLVLGGAPLMVRFRPSFGAALALAALVVLGLSQLVGYLRRESD